MYGLTHKSLKIAEYIQPDAFKEAREVNLSLLQATDQLNAAHKTGLYLNKSNMSDLRVLTLKDDTLYASRSINGYQQPLIPVSMNKFVNKGSGETAYEFVTAGDGKPEKICYREHANSYTLEKIQKANLDRQQLKAYKGTYYSPELKQKYHANVL